MSEQPTETRVRILGFGDSLACGCCYQYQRSGNGSTRETVLRCPRHAGEPGEPLPLPGAPS